MDVEHESDLAVMLSDISDFVSRFVVMSSEQADAVALWVAHTHSFDAAEATPYLAITSAEKRSGKTLLLELLELLVAKPWLTGRTSAAALARYIEKEQPTLLLDESDAALGGDREYAETLRGVLNTGYRRRGRTTLCIGPNHEVTHLSTFSPKAIAGIGELPGTVADRSIPIRLTRKGAMESVERFRRRRVEPLARGLVEPLEELLQCHVETIAQIEPQLPDELDDRAQDVWEPLLAIAQAAGAPWPARASAAALELCAAEKRLDTETSLGTTLLRDIRDVFARNDADRLKTSELLWALASIDEAPWGNWYGRQIHAQQLAKLLKPFGIRPREPLDRRS